MILTRSLATMTAAAATPGKQRDVTSSDRQRIAVVDPCRPSDVHPVQLLAAAVPVPAEAANVWSPPGSLRPVTSTPSRDGLRLCMFSRGWWGSVACSIPSPLNPCGGSYHDVTVSSRGSGGQRLNAQSSLLPEGSTLSTECVSALGSPRLGCCATRLGCCATRPRARAE